jgi:hypothetical protein
MPYQRSSTRLLRRHFISYQDLCRANDQVCAELVKLSLWSPRLESVEVYWVPASWAYHGWYQSHIYIPAVNGPQLADFIAGQHTRLTDVLRHEWAHALAEKRDDLTDTPRFIRTFGGPYESSSRVHDYHPARHLTKYSATMPCEDFAEVFHYYLRHKGRLPVRLINKPIIVKKWQFIDWMAKRIKTSEC